MFDINEKVLIPSLDSPNKEVEALFKGYIDDKLCYVKPKAKFVKGGYGTTITCHINNIRKHGGIAHENKKMSLV